MGPAETALPSFGIAMLGVFGHFTKPENQVFWRVRFKGLKTSGIFFSNFFAAMFLDCAAAIFSWKMSAKSFSPLSFLF